MKGNGARGPLWNKGRVWSSTRMPRTWQGSVVLPCGKGDLGFSEGSGSSGVFSAHPELECGVEANTKSY